MGLPSIKARRGSCQAKRVEVTDRIRTMWFCLSGVITWGHVGIATPRGDERLGWCEKDRQYSCIAGRHTFEELFEGIVAIISQAGCLLGDQTPEHNSFYIRWEDET